VISMTWKFESADHRSLSYILKYPPNEGDVKVVWEHTMYKGGALIYSDYYYNPFGWLNAHSATIRVPLASTTTHNVHL
jgi:hypothetical protein